MRASLQQRPRWTPSRHPALAKGLMHARAHAATAPGAAAGLAADVIVVGGGIGGLVAAGRIAKEGMKVLLLEQGEQVGGRCQSLELAAATTPSSSQASAPTGTFRFDTGPSLLLFPNTYRSTYAALGQNMADHVPVNRVEPAAYRVHFEQGGHLDMLYDQQQMVEQLEAVEKGAGGQYLSWLASARAALEAGMSAFIEKDFDSPLDMLDLPKLLPLLPRLNILELLGRHHDQLAWRFKDPRLRAMFTFQDLYVGLSPYNAPGAFSLLSATEITDGVFYPMGGFQKVGDSLRSIAESLGVEIRTRTRVASVMTSADGKRVTGVALHDGSTLAARAVITNRDLPSAYGMLQGGAQSYGQAEQDRISKLDYSAGVIAFNWCVAGKVLPGLLHHNVFLSREYEQSWQRATGPGGLVRCPNFYVHCPTRTDPTAAPEGCESVMVLLPVANMQQMAAKAGQELSSGSGQQQQQQRGRYAELVAAGREAVLRTLCEAGVCSEGVEGLRAAITRELVIEPEAWAQRYGLMHGAAFGLAHGLDQLAAFRPAIKDPKVEGLYFAGASTRPGNGVPLCMISADLVSQRVLQDMKRAPVVA